MSTWTKVDLQRLDDPPSHLEPSDRCWFLRDLLVDRGSAARPWELSQSNQLVYDLEIKPLQRGNAPLWAKKMAAIETFAQELARNIQRSLLFAAIPGSKIPGHPEHDDRLDLVLIRAQQINPNIQIARPLRRTQSIDATHTRSGRRSPSDHIPSLAFTSLQITVPEAAIFLIDDVLTSGSTFKACQQIIRTARPDLEIAGIFWARRKTVPPVSAAVDFQGI
jgi:hypothetical protein